MRFGLVVALAGYQVACMASCGDMFVPTKRLAGAYSLVRFEGKRHYVVKEGVPFDGGGVLQGMIGELGWNERYIVGKRWAMSSALGSGWMIIEVESGEITGPFSDAGLSEVRQRDPRLLSIKVLTVSQAWKDLGGPYPW